MRRRSRVRPRFAWLGTLALLLAPCAVRAQTPAAPAPAQPAEGVASSVAEPAEGAFAVLPPEVQVVQFRGPEGAKIELLGPPAEPVALNAPAEGSAPMFGLRVGTGYRLRISNLPDRPGVEIYPVIEVVGHLHRPPNIDPARFPIRVIFRDADIDDVLVHGRLVTHVVYLEDPEQALPMSLPKNDIPTVTIGPAEDPLKVSTALGRPMAIMRIGGRIPNPDEWSLSSSPLIMPGEACPFTGSGGGRCPLPCGPRRSMNVGGNQSWLPRDEYLCDGGDHGEVVSFGTYGGVRGVDPRDALIKFDANYRPRLLPTNTVCLYAPRFAMVRASVGANQALTVTVPAGAETTQYQDMVQFNQRLRKFTKNETAEAFRHRSRVSEVEHRDLPLAHSEIRILQGYDEVAHLAGHVFTADSMVARNRQKAVLAKYNTGPLAIKTAESAVLTGIIQSAGQTVMSWPALEVAGVELHPEKPGVAVIKRVSQAVAEPGDEITVSIQYRNMGSVPITSVSVIDSLLPRLEYVPGSALGPQGTVFTATDNRAGSTELRWDLPGGLAPGAEGYVAFRARVR